MNHLHSSPRTPDGDFAFGNVFIMTHSIFSDVIRIGCTPDDSEEYAKSLSSKSPGDYQLFFSMPCDNPCKVNQRLQQYFNTQKFVNEFYEVSPESAKAMLEREALKIPVLNMH